MIRLPVPCPQCGKPTLILATKSPIRWRKCTRSSCKHRFKTIEILEEEYLPPYRGKTRGEGPQLNK
jgi:hypothetical protein